MPRFMLRRVWGEVDEATLAKLSRRSREIGDRDFPDIVWEHSHVTVDPDGVIVSFCVYQAPDPDLLIQHSQAVGAHFIDEILEIAGDVTPDDFPPEPATDPADPAGV